MVDKVSKNFQKILSD